MSALGHKRTFAPQKVMSALPPNSGHPSVDRRCPLCANSGHRQRGSRPLRAGAKIQSSTHPLGEVICFFIPCARCGLQHIIGDFVHKEVFFILIAGHVIHCIDPNVHGCRQAQHMRRPDYRLIASNWSMFSPVAVTSAATKSIATRPETKSANATSITKISLRLRLCIAPSNTPRIVSANHK